jgi:DivIVA domain-containing protein
MWFFGLIVVLLIGAVAVVASGRWGAMSTAYDDRPDMTVPARQALTATDIESARFAVGLRGYRMDEVDTLLERVAKEVAERDRRIADLERAVAPIVDTPEGIGFISQARYDPADFDDTGTQQPILVGGDFPDPAPKADSPEPKAEEPGAPAQGAPTEQAAAGPAAAAEPAAVEPTPAEQTLAERTLAERTVAERTAAEPAAGEQTTGEPAVVGQTPAERAVGESAGPEGASADDEPDTAEVPRLSQAAAADEYERLQAEARALLEARSQPGAPRRTPAESKPAAAGDQEALSAARTNGQPAPAPDQPQNQRQPQARPQAQAERQPQNRPQPQTEPRSDSEEQVADEEQEGWQFWPPADQQGEGAYQRPS